MKSIVFDTGPIISLTTNNLLWLLNPLKERLKGEFYITHAIKGELIDRPIETKRFKFEALQVLRSINRGSLSVLENVDLQKKTNELLDLANTIFQVHGNYMNIVHYAEIEGLAASIYLNADAFVVDERTTRILVENPKRLIFTLKRKLHEKINVDWNKLKEFRKLTKNIQIIRSVDLVARAYELNLLDEYLLDIPHPKRTLLESVLWAVKLHGCSVSRKEIESIVKLEQV